MCGRLMPTTFRPSPGNVLICAHSSAPPAPALYWMTVSIAGHFFFSTTCWWRADRSDSPPGGNACQYRRAVRVGAPRRRAVPAAGQAARGVPGRDRHDGGALPARQG